MTEQDIQRKIKVWLESKGAKVTKYNANGYGVSGHPDLFVSFPRKPHPIAFYVEVKTPEGRLSLIQQTAIEKIRSLGHLVVVARSIEDVLKFLKEKKVISD